MSSNNLLQRIPPHTQEAEAACLGAMIQSPQAVDIVFEHLVEEDFFEERHRIIFSAINFLNDHHSPIDVVTLAERLKTTQNLSQIGGAVYLSQIIEQVPALSNVLHYVKIVKEKSMLRALINAARTIIDNVYDQQMDPTTLSDEAERLIFEITNKKSSNNYVLLKNVIQQTLKGIDRMSHSNHTYTGLPTGFKDFDDMTGGLGAGDLVVIAARPSMGKTALALNIANNILERDPENKAVLFFSLEMSAEELSLRMLSTKSRLRMQQIRKGELSEGKGEWKDLIDAAGRLSLYTLLVDDTPSISINEIRSKSRRLKSKYDIDIMIIDHMQLITTVDSAKSSSFNRNAEISYISRSLKALAKELKIPVVVLSQLSRAVESRTDKHPMLSDLRESGAIEQDADIVSFLYRDDYYNENSEHKNVTELKIGKQRNGPTGTVNLVFLKEFLRFENAAPLEDSHSYHEESDSY